MTDQPAAPTCYRHPRRETYVTCVRCDRPICPDCMRSAAVGFQCPECLRAGQRGTRTARTTYGGRLASGNPDVSLLLILANVGVFAATSLSGAGLGFGGSRSTAFDRFALIPRDVALQHQYYRFVSSMFLHFSVAHIVLNMLALWYIGPALESVLGRLRFAGLYLLAGLGGAVGSYLFGSVGEVAAGASGAVFGLFAAYFVLARRSGRDVRGIAALILLNLVISVAVPNIDLRAHLGGLITGGLVAAAYAYAPLGRWRAASQALGTSIVILILAAAADARTVHLRHLAGL